MLRTLIADYDNRLQQLIDERRHLDYEALNRQMGNDLLQNPPSIEEILGELNAAYAQPEHRLARYAFRAASSNLSPEFAPILSQIVLCASCATWHEYALEILEDLPTVATVEPLKKALSYRWDFDQWLSVPRKAMRALIAIGTPESIALVQEAKNSPEHMLRREAFLLIDCIDIDD